MNFIDFTVDEKIYLNKNALDVSLQDFLNGLKLAIICSQSNSDDEVFVEVVLDMLNGLYSKFLNVSDDEWASLQDALPFRDLNYTDLDNEEFVELMEE